MSDRPVMRGLKPAAEIISLLTGLAIVVGWVVSSSFLTAVKIALPSAGILFIFSALAWGGRAFYTTEMPWQERVIGTLVMLPGLVIAIWFLLTGSWFFFAAWGVFVILVAMVAGLLWLLDRAQASAYKVCPQCAERVRTEAKVCRYCGHNFDAA